MPAHCIYLFLKKREKNSTDKLLNLFAKLLIKLNNQNHQGTITYLCLTLGPLEYYTQVAWIIGSLLLGDSMVLWDRMGLGQKTYFPSYSVTGCVTVNKSFNLSASVSTPIKWIYHLSNSSQRYEMSTKKATDARLFL